MNDILSQIIAYAPDKIDTDVKLRSLVQAPLTMAQVPRSEMDNFNTPDLDQGAWFLDHRLLGRGNWK